jgi:hypothetical protein
MSPLQDVEDAQVDRLPDAAWLTRVLHKSGCICRAVVTEMNVQRIGAEMGFLDSVSRVMLTYDQAEAGAPRSVVIKVSTAQATYRQIGEHYDAYEREFHFYEAVAPQSPIRLARCFGREVDPATHVHYLVLEDLGALAAGDQVAGLTPAQAQGALETIGRFHAA